MFDKEFVSEDLISTRQSGERGRVFDPLEAVRDKLHKLTTPENTLGNVVSEMSMGIVDDLNTDAGNRERIDKSLDKGNLGLLAAKLNQQIATQFTSDESRCQAGALAELYIRMLTTWREFEKIEASRSAGYLDYLSLGLLKASGLHWESCLRLVIFFQHRNEQDKLRFATPADSDKRQFTYFDQVIGMVNDVVGIRSKTPSLKYSRMNNILTQFRVK